MHLLADEEEAQEGENLFHCIEMIPFWACLYLFFLLQSKNEEFFYDCNNDEIETTKRN